MPRAGPRSKAREASVEEAAASPAAAAAGGEGQSGRERLVAAALTMSVSLFCGSMFAKAVFYDTLRQSDAVKDGWWKGAMKVIQFMMEFETGQKLEEAPFSGPPGLLLQLVGGFSALFLAAGYMMMRRSTTSAVIAIFMFIQLMVGNDAEGKLPIFVEGSAIRIHIKTPEEASAFFDILATSHTIETTALIMCTAMCVYACAEEHLSMSKAGLAAALGFSAGLVSRTTGVDAAIINGLSSAEVRNFATSYYGVTVSVVYDGDMARVPMMTACAAFVLATLLARVVSVFVFRTAMSTFSVACAGVGVAFGGSYVEPNLRQLTAASSGELDTAQAAALLRPVAEGHLGELCAWMLACICGVVDMFASERARKYKDL